MSSEEPPKRRHSISVDPSNGVFGSGGSSVLEELKEVYRGVVQRNRYNIVSDAVVPADYEQTERMNDKRRKLLKRSNLTGIRIIFHWKYTLLVGIFLDSQLYLSLLAYGLGRYLKASALTTLAPTTLTGVGILANLFSFLLVFYLTQSYSRFQAQYEIAMSIEGRIFDAIMHARATLTPEGAWRLFRHLNAAHLLCYTGFGDVYNEANLLFPLNAKYALLNDSELHRLRSLGFRGGSCYREVLAWAIEGIKLQRREDVIDAMEMDTLVGQVFQLRGKIGALFDYADQPLPYPYIHFINLTIFLYLPVFAYCLACSASDAKAALHDSVVGGVIVFLYTAVILALRTLAQRLQEPFGNFEEDLSVLHYIRFTITMSRKILLALHVDRVSPDDEAVLVGVREATFTSDPFNRFRTFASFRTPKMEYSEVLADDKECKRDQHSRFRGASVGGSSPRISALDDLLQGGQAV